MPLAVQLRFLRCVLSTLMLACLAGCQLVGGMASAYQRNTPRTVEAEYDGLTGKSFAVLAVADRAIQAEHPQLVEETMRRATKALSQPANFPKPAGFVNAEEVIKFAYRLPSWPAKEASFLATELGGVDRIIVIEVLEFRLNEPGNTYEWAGIAGGTVTIYEVDTQTPETPAYTTTFNVDYPDQKGFGPDTLPRAAVATELLRRMIDRSTWPMLRHQEAYDPDY
jgi:hypothetical protein